MNAAELDAMLRQFLVDHKLSASERQTLMTWAEKNVTTEQKLNVARNRVFEAARQAVTDPTGVEVIDFLEAALKVIVPTENTGGSGQSSAACFSPGDACLGMIVNHIINARRTIDICVFTITDDRISNTIIAAHKRGVKIRIITDNEKAYDAGSDVPRFRGAGIPLIVDESPYHMHHKFAIFDGRRLLNGSYNWTRGAAADNEENIIDTDDRNLIAKFQHEFEALWIGLPTPR